MGCVSKITALVLVLALALVFAISARAQTLGGSCSNSGWISVQPNQVLYCNGSTWAIGHEITTTGLQGIGTTSPVVTLQVNGEVMPGNTGVGCSSTTKGALRYSSSAGALQFCDGSNWGNLPSTVCSGSTPAGFVFTNVTGAAVSTLTTSNIVQITGITCNVTVSISGTGGPQYRICSDNACSTVVTGWTSATNYISANQYVQLRLTSSNAGTKVLTATLSVGSSSSSWSVTTQAYCTGSSPTIGTACSDGTIYMGLDTGNVPMYIPPCNAGFGWSGSACTGTEQTLPYTNGTSYTSAGPQDTANGLSNTNSLVANTDAGSPYQAAMYCHNLNFGGHTDWYLPAQNQLGYIFSNISSLGSSEFVSLNLVPSTSSSSNFWTSTANGSGGGYYASAYAYTSGSIGQSGQYSPGSLHVRCMRETGAGSPNCGHSGTISTQTSQTLTVPGGCAVTFKVWGGGGGGTNQTNSPGAGGGYAYATIPAGATDVNYYLSVGGGGAAYQYGDAGGSAATGFQGGNASYPTGGGGGGASGVWIGGYGTSGTPIAIAGGGGGSGLYGISAGAGACTSGTQTTTTYGASSAGYGGGGGGGGYPTGGAVNTPGAESNGYGGSCYFSPSAGSGGTTAASGSTAANTGDANYPPNAGMADTSGGGGNGYPGAIYYSY